MLKKVLKNEGVKIGLLCIVSFVSFVSAYSFNNELLTLIPFATVFTILD